MRSPKDIGQMLDKLEEDTVKVRDVEEGCAISLIVGVFLWIIIILAVLHIVGVT